MADNQPINQNRLVMFLAGAVVVLLIAFVAVVMLNTGAKSTPTTSTTSTTASTGTSAAATATSNPGVGASTAFDPATATKVPANQAPKDYVAAYYQAILDKKWDVAFKMQPAASQQGTVADFQSTQEMYGMTAFKVFSDNVSGSNATVVIQQDLGKNGIWTATWTLVKSGGSWLVKERKVAMGAPTK